MSTPPLRTQSHRIETRAVRAAISQMSADWLVRSLDDRDYGIDLLLELFSSDNHPSGVFVHVQSKGIEGDFQRLADETIKLNFPVRTVLYAQKAHAPFFVFHTSLATGETMFLWLQKHIKFALKPGWEVLNDVTIYFDPAHKLGTGNSIFENMINNSRLEAQAVEGIRLLNWLQSEFAALANGNNVLAQSAQDHLSQLYALDFVKDKIAETPPFDKELDFVPLNLLLSSLLAGESKTAKEKQLLREASEGARDFVQILLAWAEILETDVAAYGTS